MELDWQLHWGDWYEAKKADGGFYGFQEATSEHDGKTKKQTAYHRMPHNKHLAE
jgi:hypothetical protein